jgi:hypothetical protein
MLLRKLRLPSFLLLSFALAACSPKKDTALDKDPLETGYRLIDKGETSEAIAHFEELATKDERIQVKEALASAYSARAGIHVDNYWGFLVGFQAPLLQMQSLKTARTVSQARRILTQLEGHRELHGHQGLAELAQVVAAFEMWMNRIESLPVVAGDARRDIDRAMRVLFNDNRGGGRLYRALLGLVTLKSDLTVGFESWSQIDVQLTRVDLKNPGSSKNNRLLCAVDVQAFADWTSGVLRRLNRTMEDVTIALPSKEQDLAGAMRDTARLAAELRQAAKENSCE